MLLITAMQPVGCRRRLQLPVAFFLVVLGPVHLMSGLAGGDPEQAKSILDTAARLTDMKTLGGSPFQVRANVEIFGPKGLLTTGSYALDWVTSSEWREPVSLPGFVRTRVAHFDKLWTSGDTGPPPMSYWDLQTTLRVPDGLTVVDKRLNPGDAFGFWFGHLEKISKVERRRVSAIDAVCVKIEGFAPASARTICLDAARSLPLSKTQILFGKQVEYGEYLSVGTHWYPQDLSLFQHGRLQMRIHVQDLRLTAREAIYLEPPSGSQSRPFCPGLTPDTILWRTNNLNVMPEWHAWEPELRRWQRDSKDAPWAMLYGMLGSQGKWLNLKVLAAHPTEAGDAALATLPYSTLAPATCGTQRVDEGTAILVTFTRYGTEPPAN